MLNTSQINIKYFFWTEKLIPGLEKYLFQMYFNVPVHNNLGSAYFSVDLAKLYF